MICRVSLGTEQILNFFSKFWIGDAWKGGQRNRIFELKLP